MKKTTYNYKNRIGDGKTPNLYYVQISNDYSYVQEGCIDWIGDIIPSFKSSGKMLACFDIYAEAKSLCDDMYLGQEIEGITVNRINIEDRLSGELYEKTLVFDPAKGTSFEHEHEDVRFTAKKLGESFV